MLAYEFSTQVSSSGQVAIPPQYVAEIPPGATVRVLVLVNESAPPANGEHKNGKGLSGLEKLVAEIKQMPRNPAKFTPGSGLLSNHLAHPVTEVDLNFNPQAWDQEWDQLEAQMKAENLAHEIAEMKELV